MVKSKSGVNPIRSSTAKVAMVTLGLLIIFVGLFVSEIVLLFRDSVITPLFVFFLALFATVLVVIELGFKRFTKLSSLSKWTSQQVASFIISIIVFLSALLWIFFPDLLFLNKLIGGALIAAGLAVIVEAFR